MSRFSTTIKSLEDKIYQQLRIAQELEAENAKLQKQEQALCLTLASLQGSMSALMGDRQRLQQAQDSFHTAGPTPVASTGSERPTATSSSSSSSCPPLELLAAGTEPSGTASGSTADALSKLSGEDPAACWMDLQQQLVMEQLLQGDRQQVIRVGHESPTPTSLTLARLSGSPERVASYLALTQEQRLQWLAAAVKRLALLLPKYDSLPSCMEELEAVVDSMLDRGMTYAWLDRNDCTLVQINMINMDTGRAEEAYPPGFWHNVVEGMELTPEQKCSLHALWSRTKSMQAPLVQQHEALLGELEGLQQQQRAQQQLFAQQAQQLPIKRACEALAKQRQGRASTTLLPPRPPPQPQPQQCSQERGQEEAKLSTGHVHNQPAAPAAQTLPASEGTISNSTCQQPQQQQVQVQQPQPQRTPLLLEPPLHQDPAAELLLAVPCATQRQIEARLSVLRDQLTMHEKLLTALLWNMLSKKQVAATAVGSWPFMPDAHKICGALDELGW